MIRVVLKNDNVVYINESMFATIYFDKCKRTFQAFDIECKERVHYTGVALVQYITNKSLHSDYYNVRSMFHEEVVEQNKKD